MLKGIFQLHFFPKQQQHTHNTAIRRHYRFHIVVIFIKNKKITIIKFQLMCKDKRKIPILNNKI